MKNLYKLGLIIFLTLFIFYPNKAAANNVEKLNIMLDTTENTAIFLDEVKRLNLSINYAVEEIGLYQIEGAMEGLETLTANQIVGSFDTPNVMPPSKVFTIEEGTNTKI
ncbi:hypothetical protein, partial [Solibacillus cecembensis]|uniref:hypothetical protein n=1 Tax=Solibacillus cecembensis TaxID=459347 RepID=UPI003D080E50